MYATSALSYQYSFTLPAIQTLPYLPVHGGGAVSLGVQMNQALLIQNTGGENALIRFGQAPTNHRFDVLIPPGGSHVIEPTDPFLQNSGGPNLLGYSGGPINLFYGSLIATVTAPTR